MVFGDEKENPFVEISEENKHNNAMAKIQSIKVRIGDLSFVKGFGFRGLFIVAIERLKLQREVEGEGEGDLRAECEECYYWLTLDF
jgi:Zn finger protein HypA/HybF involved in hydrogenase expression